MYKYERIQWVFSFCSLQTGEATEPPARPNGTPLQCASPYAPHRTRPATHPRFAESPRYEEKAWSGADTHSQQHAGHVSGHVDILGGTSVSPRTDPPISRPKFLIPRRSRAHVAVTIGSAYKVIQRLSVWPRWDRFLSCLDTCHPISSSERLLVGGYPPIRCTKCLTDLRAACRAGQCPIGRRECLAWGTQLSETHEPLLACRAFPAPLVSPAEEDQGAPLGSGG